MSIGARAGSMAAASPSLLQSQCEGGAALQAHFPVHRLARTHTHTHTHTHTQGQSVAQEFAAYLCPPLPEICGLSFLAHPACSISSPCLLRAHTHTRTHTHVLAGESPISIWRGWGRQAPQAQACPGPQRRRRQAPLPAAHQRPLRRLQLPHFPARGGVLDPHLLLVVDLHGHRGGLGNHGCAHTHAHTRAHLQTCIGA